MNKFHSTPEQKISPVKMKVQDHATAFKTMHPEIFFIRQYGQFFKLDNEKHYFKPMDKYDLRGDIIDYLDANQGKDITHGIIDNIIMLLEARGNFEKELNTKHIIFNNDLVLNLNDFEIRPYDNTDRVFYYVDCQAPFEQTDCPVFKQFLESVLVYENDKSKTDHQLVNLVQEMFGYYLLDRIEPPTAFFLVGDGANGKSTLLFVLEQLMGGDEFVMANSIENLTSRPFDAQELRFKRLNICTEEQSKYIKCDRFKAMIEGTKIHTDIKFADSISFRPKTKHIFATNRLPLFDTLDDGLRRRIKIIPFFRKFNSFEADKTLKTPVFSESRFNIELPAIARWAIEGAKRLIENNYVFSDADATDNQLCTYEAAVSSVISFMKENFVDMGDRNAEFFTYQRLYRIYVEWCKRNNKKPFSSTNFKDELKINLGLRAEVDKDLFENREDYGYYANIRTNSEILSASVYFEHINTEKKMPNFDL